VVASRFTADHCPGAISTDAVLGCDVAQSV
jgi:hypothetical protein